MVDNCHDLPPSLYKLELDLPLSLDELENDLPPSPDELENDRIIEALWNISVKKTPEVPDEIKELVDSMNMKIGTDKKRYHNMTMPKSLNDTNKRIKYSHRNPFHVGELRQFSLPILAFMKLDHNRLCELYTDEWLQYHQAMILPLAAVAKHSAGVKPIPWIDALAESVDKLSKCKSSPSSKKCNNTKIACPTRSQVNQLLFVVNV